MKAFIPAMILSVLTSVMSVPARAENATHYELKGKSEGTNIEIIYDVANIAGQSMLSVKEGGSNKTFSGGDIRKESSSDLTEMISVTLSPGHHGDPITLTILIPRVVTNGKQPKVSTYAIKVWHKSDLSDNSKGQRDLITAVQLKGKAVFAPS